MGLTPGHQGEAWVAACLPPSRTELWLAPGGGGEEERVRTELGAG